MSDIKRVEKLELKEFLEDGNTTDAVSRQYGPRKLKPIMEPIDLNVPEDFGLFDMPNAISDIMAKHIKEVMQGMDDLIKKRLIERGVDPTKPELLKGRLVRARFELESDWEHYILDGERLISFQDSQPMTNLDEGRYGTTFKYY